ncbi:MAG: aldo/keto reductase [Rhizobiales bacterium]|nr:aldo/keto reductase [Hyphomicrobiales bacterium]NRB14601.1 aldo/keto reductase [Hyphomicrobiales bacterium]
MEYRKLGRSGIDVSAICLGTMTWGQQNTQAEGFEQMDYALEQGINFFDTAELYSIPPKADTQGSTETIIGNYFAERKNRDKVILASKVVGRSGMNWFRADGSNTQLNRANMEEALNNSLRRLQTDYIDLYQLHWPDRPTLAFGAAVFKDMGGEKNTIAEILDVLDGFVKAGKIRHIGLSNESSWGTAKFLQLSEVNGQARVQSVQNAYNFLNRAYEYGLAEFAHREDCGLLAYSPLAQGILSGKYLNGAKPAGARKTLFGRMDRYETPGAVEATTKYVQIAKDFGVDAAQMANQFVTTRSFVTSNIFGATTMEQLKSVIDSVNLDITEEMEAAINAVHAVHTNPCV